MFHNSNVFGSYIIHNLCTECAKIKKNNSGTKRLKLNNSSITAGIAQSVDQSAGWVNRVIAIHFLAGVTLLSPLQSVQNISGLRPPITYEMGTGAVFNEAKRSEHESDSLPPSCTEVTNICSLAYASMLWTEQVCLSHPISCSVITMPPRAKTPKFLVA